MTKTPDDDDDFLWTHVTRDVRPLKGGAAKASSPTRVLHTSAVLHMRTPRRFSDEVENPPDRAAKAKPASSRQVDLKTAKRLQQGRMTIEARLDLHGYRVEAARAELRRFVTRSAAMGRRCVLVVTGKGALGRTQDMSAPFGVDDDTPRGAIRRAFPIWLQEDPLDHLVLRAAQAKLEDGGTGAFYLYLRRDRNKDR